MSHRKLEFTSHEKACIEACFACAELCNACGNDMIGMEHEAHEDMELMERCIRLCRA